MWHELSEQLEIPPKFLHTRQDKTCMTDRERFYAKILHKKIYKVWFNNSCRIYGEIFCKKKKSYMSYEMSVVIRRRMIHCYAMIIIGGDTTLPLSRPSSQYSYVWPLKNCTRFKNCDLDVKYVWRMVQKYWFLDNWRFQSWTSKLKRFSQ